MFVAATGTNGGTPTGVPTVTNASTTTAPTSGSNLDATTETTPGSTSETATGGGNRKGARRLIINSSQQLQNFMTDHLNAHLESSNVDCWEKALVLNIFISFSFSGVGAIHKQIN